jgi:hypothetical protein
VHPTCPGCGYDLTGTPGGPGEPRCPECGRRFGPDRPQDLLPPWPSTGVILVLLWAPSAAVYALTLPAMWLTYALVAPLSGILAGFVVMGVLLTSSVLGLVVAPAVVVRQLVQRHGDEPGGGIGFGVAFPAVVANLVAWLVMLSMLGVML